MSEANLFRITPCVSAKDVDGMVRFFAEVLGFEICVQSWDFAYVQRESTAVRIHKTSEGPEERFEVGPRAFLFYVDVRDISLIVDEVRPKLLAAEVTSGLGPKDQSWGQREFWVPIPDGGLVIFGQEIVTIPQVS